MAYTLQSMKVSCRGGLDLRSTDQELMSKPGAARILRNFECSSSGGYRRINGYSPWELSEVPGEPEEEIKGIHVFNGTLLVAKGTNLYHSFDGITWTQVNKDLHNRDHAQTEAETEIIPLHPDSERVNFAHYTNGTVNDDYVVMIADGVGHLTVFTISGTSEADAVYSFKALLHDAPSTASHVFTFKDQIYTTGDPEKPSVVSVSSLFNVDNFSGTSSLEISTADKVVGLRSFRDRMVVFCENSLFYLVGVAEANPQLVPITKNIGCVDGNTVQEIGGDLIFLAPDGLRNIAATERIDDTELSVVSFMVSPIVENIVRNRNNFILSSVVLRESNQYRLYYSCRQNRFGCRGLIGTIVSSDQGVSWNWSEYNGGSIRVPIEGYIDNNYSSLCTIGGTGKLYRHNYGNLFDEEVIRHSFLTPYFDFGDASIRKNLHRVTTFVDSEGLNDVYLQLSYTDYNDEMGYRPEPYPLGEFRKPSMYGDPSSRYGNPDTRYGSNIVRSKKVNVEGSGFTIAFRYYSGSPGSSYNIQGFDIDFKPAGKV